MKKLSFITLCCTLMFFSCKKEEIPPDNPYDSIDRTEDTNYVYIPDPNSIVGIHQNILTVKCNNPGCHDGTFEPDFRSVQSAWSTLVYHSVVKNTLDSAYTYRVVPGDTGNSMLWRRLTVEDPALQRMPATGDYLTADELENVRQWIANGALDMFGNPASLPNGRPMILNFVALDGNFQTISGPENRVDSIFYNPFKVNLNQNFTVAMFVEDDSTAIEDLQTNRLKISNRMNDFSSASFVQATYLNVPGFQVWVASVTISPGQYQQDSTYFMRYYVNDGDHSTDTEFPRDESLDPYKTYYAFKVNP